MVDKKYYLFLPCVIWCTVQLPQNPITELTAYWITRIRFVVLNLVQGILQNL